MPDPASPVRLPFTDRVDAGRQLAAQLVEGPPLPEAVVLGLPRGGVPVAAQVAVALGLPLDVFLVRKLGVPGQPELAMGAISTGGVRVLNDDVVRHLEIAPETIDEVARHEALELSRREREYRGDRPPIPVGGRTVVLVDDGLATGATMRAAVEAVRAAEPHGIVVAVPVGAPDTCRRMAELADGVVCLHAPDRFGAVGAYYRDFGQTSDDEVRDALRGQGSSSRHSSG